MEVLGKKGKHAPSHERCIVYRDPGPMAWSLFGTSLRMSADNEYYSVLELKNAVVPRAAE
jgi:hypothetical protein